MTEILRRPPEDDVRADRYGMPFCCGIEVVGNFNGGYKKIDTRKPIAEQVKKIHGIVLATTVEWQWEAIEALKELGFVQVCRFWNDVHIGTDAPKGNLVTLWLLARADGNVEWVRR